MSLRSRLSCFISAVSLFLLAPASLYAAETDILPEWGIKVSVNFKAEKLAHNKQKLLALIDNAFVHYKELFGGPPKKLNGEPYDRLTINVYDDLTYEADPEMLDIGIHNKQPFGFYRWELGVLHEMLHLWSGETFKYTDGHEQWFNEGVGDYLALRLGAKLGLIPQDKIISTFAIQISTYLAAKGVGEVSLRTAGSTDQLKRDHYFLVYHGGYVVGLVLDHQIRMRSKGKASLDDFMLNLYRTNSRSVPYSMKTLIVSLRESTGIDFTTFFKRYVDGLEIIPVGSFFDIGMLEIFYQYGLEIEGENQKVLRDMLTFDGA